MPHRQRVWVIVVLAALGGAGIARGADSYYQVELAKLTLTDGQLPQTKRPDRWSNPGMFFVMRGYAVLDGPGEVYVTDRSPYGMPGEEEGKICIRAPQGQGVTGRLFEAKEDGSGMAALKFMVTADQATAEARKAFALAKVAYYSELRDRRIPGTAWFRLQVAQTTKEFPAELQLQDGLGQGGFATGGEGDQDSTYDLFSGGLALSENLQLERLLPSGGHPEEASVDVDAIAGLAVAAMDWKPLVKDLHPQLDPLAGLAPADQHAIFFSSIDAAAAVMDEADRHGTPVLQMTQPRSEDARTKDRYQRQLGLSLTELGRLAGPELVDSIAVTGSDPYLRVGSDVAVLFQGKAGVALYDLLLAQIELKAGADPGGAAATSEGEAAGVKYTAIRTSDRRISSYVARLGDAVVVTNSLKQLEKLAAVRQGKAAALAAQPEYIFFRDRYPRGDGAESGLLVLSDAAIRRWCSARWRIADARRTCAAAILADEQAQNLDELAKGRVTERKLFADRFVPELGELQLTQRGVTSSTYGSLEFMTPIAELDFKKVTATEAQTYERWRDGYARNWSNFFDPIAVRFTVEKHKLAADVTVMPLIEYSEYRPMVQISQGVELKDESGDPHGALLHWVMAINAQSEPMKQWAGMGVSLVPGLKADPLGWLGEWVTLYADNDPFWGELAQAPDKGKFMEGQVSRLPVALAADVGDNFKLAAFLTALHAFVDQSAPGMVVWETVKYKDQPYVKITQTDQRHAGAWSKVAVYYVAADGMLLVTLNEDLLQRAIDRQQARRQAATAPSTQPWLGKSLAFRADHNALGLLLLGALESSNFMQEISWNNLPILNEWHRRYGDQDPAALHERLWCARLLDPAGGAYVWNEKYQTMESTVYGCPAQPKSGPQLPPILDGIAGGDFGVTFEAQGLRARGVVRRGDK